MALPIRTILCPVDMSPASRLVLSWAAVFARTFGAGVTVLHAESVEPPRYFAQSQLDALSAQAEANRAILRDELLRQTGEIFPPEVAREIVVEEGHPVSAIRKQVAERSPDLIVLGSHGRSGVARLLLGSVAENVVREATCLTLVVKGPDGAVSGVRRVLCPVNFTDLARRCVDVASEVALAFRADLEILHAAEDDAGEPGEVRQRLCGWVPGEARGRCEVVEVVRKGPAAEQIVLQAAERAVDLIVLGARHSPFLEFTTVGTTTERVIRHGARSVLLVPR